MELKFQVCTKKQGEEFEKLGVKAKSYFMWILTQDGKWVIIPNIIFNPLLTTKFHHAYSAAELDEMLESFQMLYNNEELELYQASNIWRPELHSNISAAQAKYKCKTHKTAATILEVLKFGVIKPADIKL